MSGEDVSLLRRPIVWGAVVLAALLGGIMTYAYVGAFVDPISELHGLPMGLVVLDRPADAAGVTVAVGAQLQAELTAPAAPGAATSPVTWEVLPTRQAAVDALNDNRLVGAIVIPAEVSAEVVAIGTSLGTAPPAGIEVLRNPGAGSLQPAVVDRVATRVVDDLSTAVSTQLTSTLAGLQVQVSPTAVDSLARPITAATTDVPALGGTSGRGLPPFYVAVMITLTGVIGATVLHVLAGAAIGREHLHFLGRDAHVRTVRRDPLARWRAEALIAVPLSVLGGLAVVGTAVGIVGAEAQRPWAAALFAVLGVLAITEFALAMLTAFGTAGDLVVLLVTTIFGVPSARGVYPAEAIPRLFVRLGDVLPLRFLTDGMRSLFFFGGRAQLGAGITGMLVWAVGSIVLGAAIAEASARRWGVEPVESGRDPVRAAGQRGVASTSGEEFGVGPAFDDLTGFDDEDLVGGPDGGEPVGDHE